MDFSGFVVQALNGLAGASSLFLVAAVLSTGNHYQWFTAPGSLLATTRWLGLAA